MEDEKLQDIEEVVEEDSNIEKQKKPRTEKQIEAFKKVIEKREENRRNRASLREQEEITKKTELENKILKKATMIKKKQIKKEFILDDISSDDEPIESIKKKIIKSEKIRAIQKTATLPSPPVPVKPILIYM